MKEIDGVKYVTKDDIVKAGVEVTKKITEEVNDSMSGFVALMIVGDLVSELFPKEDKENKED